MAGPAPTLSATAGVEPSDSPAAGSGLRVERSADTGTAPMLTTATATAAGTYHRKPPNIHSRHSTSSNGARKAASPNFSPHAMTRLARIAVLVQNSSVVGPS